LTGGRLKQEATMDVKLRELLDAHAAWQQRLAVEVMRSPRACRRAGEALARSQTAREDAARFRQRLADRPG
jgi:hypothetical protein